MTKTKLLTAAAVLLVGASVSHAATFASTDTYTGYSGQATAANNSPFFSVFGNISQQDPNNIAETTSVYDFRGLSSSVSAGESYFFLEDLQDGQFDVIGATLTTVDEIRTEDGVNGSIDRGNNADNVAEDTLRRSAFRETGVMRFDFNAAELGGNLPTHAGIVFVERDAGSPLGTDLGNGRLVRAYDASDNLLEEAFVAGTDPEFVTDGFVGLSTSTGISYITVDGDNEYDHFQYGYVPEPSAFGLIAGAFAFSWIALRRRRA